MPNFILICRDKPNSLDLRMETRPAHLDYFNAYGPGGLVAGPMLDDNGKPKGSVLIIEAEDQAAAEAFAQNDPYAKAGLFESVEIQPMALAAGAFVSKT
ncbi:YciI family protein [Hyphococcus formosus]|uniref:YciI family protein n=1 Tax=Hyphococcus formosus TaxID=3143534 RepID=UPI00398B64B6